MSDTFVALYQGAIGRTIEEIAEDLGCVVETVVRDFSISHRIKDISAIKKKMVLKGARTVFELDDVYGLRILVSSVENVYVSLQALRRVYPGYIDHDYIAHPKTRSDLPQLAGKSLRLVQMILYRNNVPFEVQITTFEFHKVNELLHDRYHREKYD